jgi:hypothetical protein
MIGNRRTHLIAVHSILPARRISQESFSPEAVDGGLQHLEFINGSDCGEVNRDLNN